MKAKVVTFDSRAELKAWFDLKGEEDRAIIFSHRENLPNNMVKYEAVVATRQGVQRIPEKASVVVRRFLERYTGTLGITTSMADGAKLVAGRDGVSSGTGTILTPKGPSFATKILNHLKDWGQARDAGSINRAIGYQGPGLGSIYTNLTKTGKLLRLARGYYIHPDHAPKPMTPVATVAPQPYPPKPEVTTIAAPLPMKDITPPNNSGANGSQTAHRLDLPAKALESSLKPTHDEFYLIERLGYLAVKLKSPQLFQKIVEIEAILNGVPDEVVIPFVQAAPAELKQAPEVTLTKRQQNFGEYLKDKTARDITPKELVENVLGKEYVAGRGARFIYDTDMQPHGWFRTRDGEGNKWRHESRRRHRRFGAALPE